MKSLRHSRLERVRGQSRPHENTDTHNGGSEDQVQWLMLTVIWPLFNQQWMKVHIEASQSQASQELEVHMWVDSETLYYCNYWYPNIMRVDLMCCGIIYYVGVCFAGQHVFNKSVEETEWICALETRFGRKITAHWCPFICTQLPATVWLPGWERET